LKQLLTNNDNGRLSNDLQYYTNWNVVENNNGDILCTAELLPKPLYFQRDFTPDGNTTPERVIDGRCGVSRRTINLAVTRSKQSLFNKMTAVDGNGEISYWPRAKITPEYEG